MQHYSADINSELFRVISATEEFDGACDPAFDNDFDELERQFAEFRFTHSHEMN